MRKYHDDEKSISRFWADLHIFSTAEYKNAAYIRKYSHAEKINLTILANLCVSASLRMKNRFLEWCIYACIQLASA
jgi:hypothetical protein